MSYLDDSMAQLEVFEGIIPWMYRDTKGFVTVGVGELLASSSRAQTLSFEDEDEQPVSAETILEEYNRVLGLAAGKTPGFYRAPNSPTLPNTAVDNLLMQHVVFFDGQLSQRFANYDTFPEAAKLALLDMIFNLGVNGLFVGYPHLMQAVQNEDWVGAAAQCNRNGPSAARNKWTNEQFLSAAAPPASAPGQNAG